MQRVALHAGADAARETLEHVLVLAFDALPDRHHVTGAAIAGVHRAQDVVEQRAFVKIGVAHVGRNSEQASRELQHVVDVAGFRRAPIDAAGQFGRRPEVLVVAVAARGESVRRNDPVPEEARGQQVDGVAGGGIAVSRADQLRHLRIAVLAGEVVAVAAQRL